MTRWRVLTLTQPWATLVAIGAKRIETRSWHTNYRGPVMIHAAKGFPSWARLLLRDELFAAAIGEHAVPLGAVVATAELHECRQFGSDSEVRAGHPEADFGDFAVGRFGWYLRRVRPLSEPVPCKGSLGLWIPPPELAALVESRQLRAWPDPTFAPV